MPRHRSTTERGYGNDHQALRARWAPSVAAGQVFCHARRCLMPNRLIRPGMAWDLGHTPDRTAHTGPEHMRCNRSEGAARGNRLRGIAKHAREWHSRQW